MITNNRIREARPHVTRNEALIFERSSPGKVGAELAPLDVPAVSAAELLGQDLARAEVEGFPEVSELEVIRHFTRLSTWNYGVDTGLYPLGSCTMKYNARINEVVARLEGLATEHPYAPQALAQGCLRILHETARCLQEITGMDAISLQPAAGAQGELTGILMIRAYLAKRGNPRKYILIPDSAHGTNPASVAISGYEVRHLKSNEQGCIDIFNLAHAMDADVAGLMLTNPNTLGIFETEIGRIVNIVHARGGLVYMDGANMNAQVGLTNPGIIKADVCHLNLHKTFSTPHGGGGPGAGPVGVKQKLQRFLPVPRIIKKKETYSFDYDFPDSIGKIKATYGNVSVILKAYIYILLMGGNGLTEASEIAVLNANYMKKKLIDTHLYELPFRELRKHEFVLSAEQLLSTKGIRALDIAKRLLDYGLHPPTIYFPHLVNEALMIEPTESESKKTLDIYIDTLVKIAQEDPELVKNAPRNTAVQRIDEVGAVKNLILTWKTLEK